MTAPLPIWPQARMTEWRTFTTAFPHPPTNQNRTPYTARRNLTFIQWREEEKQKQTNSKSWREKDVSGSVCMKIEIWPKLQSLLVPFFPANAVTHNSYVSNRNGRFIRRDGKRHQSRAVCEDRLSLERRRNDKQPILKQHRETHREQHRCWSAE